VLHLDPGQGVLRSERCGWQSLEQFRQAGEKPGPARCRLVFGWGGLEPRDFKVVAVKSPQGFRAEFGPFAADIILSDCPGCASSRFDRLPYRIINRPLWPLDPIDDWRKVAWIRRDD